VRLANLYRETGDLEAAAYELEESLKVKPLYVPAQIALGVVRFSLQDVPAAMKCWQRVLELDPQNRAAQMYLRMVQNAPRSVPPGRP
jgi:tetratricopeptide (TPR) repeat protein